MTEVALIACCKSKRHTAVPIPAAELYTGTLFRAQLAYARQVLKLDDSCIFVLSAKYYLVRITAPIMAYEQTLSEMGQQELELWAWYVRNRLAVFCGMDGLDKIWMLAGKMYRRPLLDHGYLSDYFPKAQIVVPHAEGYGIGQQIAWYQAEARKAI